VTTADAIIECSSYQGGAQRQLTYDESFVCTPSWTPGLHTDLQADLMTVAGVVTIADRAFRRSLRLGQWTRSFRLTVTVIDRDRWEPVAAPLAQTLGFLTGDNWEFQFRGRSRNLVLSLERAAEDPPPVITLFSGGLDSFCGVSSMLRDGGRERDKAPPPVLVTAYHNDLGRLRRLLANIAAAAREAPYAFAPVGVRVYPSRIGGSSTVELPERTRRSRSFLFLSLAAAAAFDRGAREVRLYENGVVAINLPHRGDLTSGRATRHAHPYFLQQMTTFLSTLAPDSAPTIVNPFIDRTKAEILQEAAGFEPLVSQTITCWGYPNTVLPLRRRQKDDRITHCGFCFPCVVRRVSLHAASVADDPHLYGSDVFAAGAGGFPRSGDRVQADQWTSARSLLGFARRIRDMQPAEFYRGFLENLIHLDPSGVQRGAEQARKLYLRFADEVVNAFS
jgi:7-cyano-7-deazaguanine synthase in queuosine biosynthesis